MNKSSYERKSESIEPPKVYASHVRTFLTPSIS